MALNPLIAIGWSAEHELATDKHSFQPSITPGANTGVPRILQSRGWKGRVQEFCNGGSQGVRERDSDPPVGFRGPYVGQKLTKNVELAYNF